MPSCNGAAVSRSRFSIVFLCEFYLVNNKKFEQVFLPIRTLLFIIIFQEGEKSNARTHLIFMQNTHRERRALKKAD